MKQRMPFVFAFVLGLAFLLMLLDVPLDRDPDQDGAAQPALRRRGVRHARAVFQHTWAEGILGFTSNGAITSWLPLFLFVILFGLSMDYHVFILSRVKERVDAGESTEDAVAHAISPHGRHDHERGARHGRASSRSSRRVRLIPIKQMGFGLAVAVLIDATVIRAVLLPASMKLLGEWNWYLPRWLEWLPSLTPEAEAQRAPPRGPVPTHKVWLIG